jgi:hypothetical protein
VAGGLLVGSIAGRIFKLVWGLIDEEEAPDPKHGEIAYLKRVGALIVEGAIIRLVRGFVDAGEERRALGRGGPPCR